MKAIDNVLIKLEREKCVSPLDYPAGFRLAAYVHQLRELGHNIITDRREDTSQGYVREIAFYTLIGKQNVIEMPKKKKDNAKGQARDLAYKLMMNSKLDGETRMLSTRIFNLLK